MSYKKNIPSTLYLILITVTLLMGCEKNGISRSIKISNSIQDVDEEMRKMNSLINAAATSLETLKNAVEPGLKNAYDSYSENLNKLEQQGKVVVKRIDEMKSSGKEYFSEWEKKESTYVNKTIRDLSEQRRNILAENYDEVRISSMTIKDSYLVYITDLREIHSFLSYDLTPSGIHALEPVIEKADKNLTKLQKSLIPAIKALDEISSQLYGGSK